MLLNRFYVHTLSAMKMEMGERLVHFLYSSGYNLEQGDVCLQKMRTRAFFFGIVIQNKVSGTLDI